MTPGDRVTVTDYGVERVGTVTPNPTPFGTLVWVRFDDASVSRWFHPESVTPVTDVQEQAR